jgi:hypothetical protein
MVITAVDEGGSLDVLVLNAGASALHRIAIAGVLLADRPGALG